MTDHPIPQASTAAFPICADGVCVTCAEPLIAAENVSIRYDSKAAVERVSLTVAPCSVTAMIGPSGCGKTSFLSCLNRLTDLTPSCRVTGKVRIGDLDIFHRDTDVRALRTRVGMVFQKPNPFPLTIWKNLALPLGQHGVKARSQVQETIETALGDVGLWDEVKDRLQTPALALSGGQQQRLCIARTLALKPDVVLLDEPCSALDPLASQVVEDLIAGLKRRYTVVIVTHNLAQARRIADAVAVFWVVDGVGRLIEHGEAARIFAAPEHPQTAAYLGGKTG